MNRETERYALAAGACILVATFAIWKEVNAPAAVLAILVTGAVFIGAEYVLEQRTAKLQIASPDSSPAPASGGIVAPVITERGEDAAPRAVTDDAVAATLDMAMLDPNSVEVSDGATSDERVVWSLRVSKHGQKIDECEDASRIDAARWVAAVADGASSSFGAARWARVLVDEFVAAPPQPLSPASFDVWLERCRQAMSGGTSADKSGWWAEEGARRGAFATLVGAAVHGNVHARVVTVMCIGDSCAFLLGGGPENPVLRRALPYEDASQFGSHPSLIGSLEGHGAVAPTWTTLPVSSGDVLVLASDAISEWLLGDARRFGRILRLRPTELAEMVIAERAAGHIVNDDLTLAVMGLS